MKGYIGLGSIAAMLILGAIGSYAAQFAPEFTLGECVGTCEIAAAGSSTFVAAEKGKKYAYGATLKTGRKSSIAIILSEGNEFRLLAESVAVAAEDPNDKTFKVVKLKAGQTDVKLDPSFHKTNKFRVETATAVCGAIGCHFSVNTSGKTTSIKCDEGDIEATGQGIDWNARMNAGDAMEFTKTDNGFTCKITAGDFDIKFPGASGKVLHVAAGDVVTATISGTTVTITVTRKNGTTESLTFEIPGLGKADDRATDSITRRFTTGVTVTPVGDR